MKGRICRAKRRSLSNTLLLEAPPPTPPAPPALEAELLTLAVSVLLELPPAPPALEAEVLTLDTALL